MGSEGGAEEGGPEFGCPPKTKSPGGNRDALLYRTNPITAVTALSRTKLVCPSYLNRGGGCPRFAFGTWVLRLTSAVLKNLPTPPSQSDTSRISAGAGAFSTLASNSAGDDKASGFRPWLLSSPASP